MVGNTDKFYKYSKNHEHIETHGQVHLKSFLYIYKGRITSFNRIYSQVNDARPLFFASTFRLLEMSSQSVMTDY